MKRFIAIFMTLCLVLGMSSVSSFAAEVGEQLSEPEVDWARYDDNNLYIQYKDFPFLNCDSQEYGYGGTASLNTRNSTTGEVKFKFIGSKFRLICVTNKEYRTSEAHVYIDNKPYTFSCATVNGFNTLVFESEELTDSVHEIIIKEFKTTGKKDYSTFGLTAIDIKGELVSPDTSAAKLSVLLNTGEAVQLSTSFNLDNNKNYTWNSTNEAVATVDANGKVTAIAEGTTDIYAQNEDGTFKEYIPVKVVEGIADELRLAVHLKSGEKVKLYLKEEPSDVAWTSMDDRVVTVSADGQITGVKKGLAIVQAELDGQKYQIYVRVNG